MHYEFFCDESRHIEKDTKNRFMVIGGIYFVKDAHNSLHQSIDALRKKHRCFGEIKWNNVSPAKLQFYLDLVDLFFAAKEPFFRCVVIDKALLRHEEFNQGSHELFFYKAYYMLLKKPLWRFSAVDIYIAYKDKFSGSRAAELIRILRNKFLPTSWVITINDPAIIPAKQSVFIQLADLFIGAVGYQHNNYSTSNAKQTLCAAICKHLGRPNLIFSSAYGHGIRFEIFIPKLR